MKHFFLLCAFYAALRGSAIGSDLGGAIPPGTSAPTGSFKHRILEQSATLDSDKLTLCVDMRNVGQDTIYLTIGFHDQLHTTWSGPDGAPDISRRSKTVEYHAPPPPLSTDMFGYDPLEVRTKLETCGSYRLDDFNFETVNIQTYFHSWLRPDDALPERLTMSTDPIDLPLKSSEIVYSNTCILDRKHKTVTCR